MKKYPIIAILLIIGWNCSSFDLTDPQKSISPALMEEYISYLASDDLKGRNTPGEDLDSAAVYIAGRFESFGLQKVNDSYLQKVDLGYVSLGEKNHLSLMKNGEEIIFNIKDGYIPFEITGNRSAQGKLVFCGYGISAPDLNYDDYSGIDVSGKIVLLFKHVPREKDSSSMSKRTGYNEYSNLGYKVKNAVQRGASGVLIVNDPLNHLVLRPVGFPWPSLYKNIPKDALPLTIIAEKYNNVPVVQVGEKFIKDVFGSIENLKDLQSEIDSENKGFSKEYDSLIVSIGTSTIIKKAPAYNVIGFLEGSDPQLKNEVLVIGAHYDHVGIKKDTEAGMDSIANGADDNASGTAGVMAIAKAFSEMPSRPKRSILFITFSGEEKGLFGSKFYLDNPLFPLDKTVAMLNLDMIGRNDPDSLYIIGYSWSPDLKEITSKENEELGFKLIYDNDNYLGGSDHAPFIKDGIAALFYHSGLHKDYHKVTDEAKLIDFTKAARVSQLAFRVAFRIANESRKYKVTEKRKILIY